MEIAFVDGEIVIHFLHETVSYDVGCMSMTEVKDLETAISTDGNFFFSHVMSLQKHHTPIIVQMVYCPVTRSISLCKGTETDVSAGMTIQTKVDAFQLLKLIKSAIEPVNLVLICHHKLCTETLMVTFSVKMVSGSIHKYEIPATHATHLHRFCTHIALGRPQDAHFAYSKSKNSTINISRRRSAPLMIFEHITIDDDVTKSVSVSVPMNKCYAAFVSCNEDLCKLLENKG